MGRSVGKEVSFRLGALYTLLLVHRLGGVPAAAAARLLELERSRRGLPVSQRMIRYYVGWLIRMGYLEAGLSGGRVVLRPSPAGLVELERAFGPLAAGSTG